MFYQEFIGLADNEFLAKTQQVYNFIYSKFLMKKGELINKGSIKTFKKLSLISVTFRKKREKKVLVKRNSIRKLLTFCNKIKHRLKSPNRQLPAAGAVFEQNPGRTTHSRSREQLRANSSRAKARTPTLETTRRQTTPILHVRRPSQIALY